MDANQIGLDYKHQYLNAICSCDAVLAIIGSNWLGLSDRLHEECDILRHELECALKLRIPVLPILVDLATMPKEDDLPEALKELARLQAYCVTDQGFHNDLEHLAIVLEKCKRMKPIDIPTPGAGAPVTGEHLALINSAWRAPKHDDRFFGVEVHRFDVILAGDSSVLNRVERIVYMLPPAWPTSPIEIDDRARSFGLKELTWSDLLVRARVYVRQQFDPVYLSSFVRLTDHGSRLVPK